MVIYCSKALIDALKLKMSDLIPMEELQDVDPAFCWHGHMAKKGGKNTIALMNDKSLFLILFRNKLPRSADRFAVIIPEAIEDTFEVSGVNFPEIKAYLENMGNVVFSYKSDRTLTGNLTNMFRLMDYTDAHEFIETETIQPYEAAEWNNRYPIYIDKKLMVPFEAMLNILIDLPK